MPETGAAEGKIAAVADAVITITDGQPSPEDVYIKPNGTVQFVNKDEANWRVRLFTREHGEHADVDLFLPARSSVTVIAPETGECRYEVLEAATLASNKFAVAREVVSEVVDEVVNEVANVEKRGGGGAIAAGGGSMGGATPNTARSGGGGGTIRIGPTP
jgi:hypothetical protein